MKIYIAQEDFGLWFLQEFDDIDRAKEVMEIYKEETLKGNLPCKMKMLEEIENYDQKFVDHNS